LVLVLTQLYLLDENSCNFFLCFTFLALLSPVFVMSLCNAQLTFFTCHTCIQQPAPFLQTPNTHLCPWPFPPLPSGSGSGSGPTTLRYANHKVGRPGPAVLRPLPLLGRPAAVPGTAALGYPCPTHSTYSSRALSARR
jgi:hypothetical protein